MVGTMVSILVQRGGDGVFFWVGVVGEAGREWIYKGMQFAAAVREPQVCCGSSVVGKVTPLLTQVLPDL